MSLNISISLWSFDTENEGEQVERTKVKEIKAYWTNSLDLLKHR